MLSINAIASEHSNTFCADCSIFKPESNQKRVTSVSVNNGVFLCADCARVHLSVLKPDVSLILPIEWDGWTVEHLGLLEAGGNHKFAQFIATYDFLDFIAKAELTKNGDTVQEVVYGSFACKYWREKLHIIRNKLPFDKDPPSLDEGRQSLDKPVEDGWLVIEKKNQKQVIEPQPVLSEDQMLQQQHYLDDDEDFRGYSKKDDLSKPKKDAATLEVVGNFLKQSGVSIKKKYNETDFKGGAAAASESIKKTFTSIKESEKTEKVISTTKKGFFSIFNKVKEMMSDPVPI